MSITVKIEVEAKTEDEAKQTLTLIGHQVAQGFRMGSDSNEDGHYNYEVTGVPKEDANGARG